MKPAPAILATALAVALVACAPTAPVDEGPSPTVEPAPSQPVGIAGIYDVDFGQFTGVYTLLDDGRFYGLHFLGDTLAGHPYGQLSPGDTATNRDPIDWANFVDDGRQVGAMEEAGSFGRRFTDTELKVAISGSMGSFSASATEQKRWAPGSAETLYLTPLDSVEGSYSGVVRSAGLGLKKEDVPALVIDSDGLFTVTALQCELAGSLVPYGATGVFELEATASGDDCGLEPTLTGIVSPLAVLDGVPTLSFQLATADGTQSVVFIVSRG